MRLRARVDDNQKQIVTALRKLGYSVLHLHALGKGAPDILVGARHKNFLFEIKDGEKTPSRQKLTPDEQALCRTCHVNFGDKKQHVEYLKANHQEKINLHAVMKVDNKK